MKIFHHVKRKFFTINKMLQHSAIVSQKSFGTILNSLTFNKIICNQQMINSSGNVVPVSGNLTHVGSGMLITEKNTRRLSVMSMWQLKTMVQPGMQERSFRAYAGKSSCIHGHCSATPRVVMPP